MVGVALTVAACAPGGTRVIVGAGTTLVDSGFADAVISEYERATGSTVSVVGESSQRLLDLARRGEVDLLLTHEPELLAIFVGEGNATQNAPVFRSRFLLVGPGASAAVLRDMDASSAFAAIADRRLAFVSRADGSGTYRQELIVWETAGIDPRGEPWYETTGLGMGPSLQVADQRQAVVLVEEGAWRAAREALGLVTIDLVDTLPNTYWATVAAGDKAQAAEELFDWLFSDAGRTAIRRANEDLFGASIYQPSSP